MKTKLFMALIAITTVITTSMTAYAIKVDNIPIDESAVERIRSWLMFGEGNLTINGVCLKLPTTPFKRSMFMEGINNAFGKGFKEAELAVFDKEKATLMISSGSTNNPRITHRGHIARFDVC